MRLSRRSEYGLRALIDLVRHERRRADRAGDARGPQPASRPSSSSRSWRRSSTAGIVRTTLGAHGGYAMAADPRPSRSGRVIRLLDGALAPLTCVSLRYYEPCSCPDEATCALRDVMLDVRDAMLEILDNARRWPSWPPGRAVPRSTRAASTPTPWPAAGPPAR